MKELKRAVITGLGAVTPIGNTVQEYWDSLKEGKSGGARISRFDVSKFKTQFACEVKGFEGTKYLEQKEIKGMDLYSQYAIAASDQAMEQAGLRGIQHDPFRAGVIFASGIGGLFSLQEEIVHYAKNDFRPRFSPFMITKMIPNIAAGILAIRYDFRGACYAVVSACASSSHALIDALNLIRLDKADMLIVGGSEAPINATALGGFSCMKAISEQNDSPQSASRPFDKTRDGFVLGEGAGAIVVESLDHAQKRGAQIIAELAGGGMTADAHHQTLPHPEGRSVYAAMDMALQDAEVKPEMIDYINPHATSTPAGDLPEILAIQKLFQNQKEIHISATKSMTGHLLGAAGAIEAIATILAIKDGIIPPTINTKELDPEIEKANLNLTLGKAVHKEVKIALSNTFGFGGQNASIVFKKYQG